MSNNLIFKLNSQSKTKTEKFCAGSVFKNFGQSFQRAQRPINNLSQTFVKLARNVNKSLKSLNPMLQDQKFKKGCKKPMKVLKMPKV